MPALILFGRRWNIGSDDFFFPALKDIIFRSAWIIAAVVIFVQDEHHLNCSEGKPVKIYFYCCFFNFSMMLALGFWLLYATTRGSITDAKARSLVPFILYFRLLVELINFAISLLGIFWVWNGHFACDNARATDQHIRWFIFVNLFTVLVILNAVFIYDPLGREHLRNRDTSKDYADGAELGTISEFLWTRRAKDTAWRCQMFASTFHCIPSHKFRDDVVASGYKEVANVWSYLLRDYDLLPSDVMAGLHTHPAVRYILEENLRRIKTKANTNIVPRSLPKYDEQINDNPLLNLSYCSILFFQYAYAAIGLFEIRGMKKKKGKPVPPPKDIIVEGDDLYNSRLEILKEEINQKSVIRNTQLKYVSFVNDYYQVPFFLAIDHCYKVYVISFRSASLNAFDIMANLTAWPVPLEVPGHPNLLVHHGFLLAASNAKARLESLELLAPLLKDGKHCNYELVVTGISMGAGIATILGMMLRSEFPDQNLLVYAYSPPGALLNSEASDYTREFVLAFVCDSDVVPRLTITNIEKAIPEVVRLIHESRKPKYKFKLGLLNNLICQYCCNWCLRETEEQMLNRWIKFLTDEEKTDKNRLNLAKKTEELVSKHKSCQTNKSRLTIPIMYLPASIIHISTLEQENKENKDDGTAPSKKPVFHVSFASREAFQEIVLTESILTDHASFAFRDAFLEMLNRFIPETELSTNTGESNPSHVSEV